MSAQFKVVKVDPEGSGVEYAGHLDMTVTGAKRCCSRCTVIFGTMGTTQDVGPFVPGELEPLNDEAKALVREIDAFRDRLGRQFTG